ncbi:hypothetical protein [Erythrobacter colymbi]|uniref:hypothetical protein n=1 Tax=Erythrobacter colymbi TaxID=1161202 RepID=UPI000A3D52F9|nr:hypothetical protein [Erythrobacter colymbi]
MNGINQPSFDPQPYDNTQKLPLGPSTMFDPGERAFITAWLGHVAAGRIGGNPAMSEESREAILANERVMFGRQRTVLD